MTNTLKVRVTLTIEVDREAWHSTYGSGETAAEIRDDVRSYALAQMQWCEAAEEGCIISAREA